MMTRLGAGSVAFAFIVSVFVSGPAADAHADLGDCGQPLTLGAAPAASDCLYIIDETYGTITGPDAMCF